MASVTISGIGKRFGESAVLRDVSLDIRHGEFLSLVGPSGCGKSTLLRTIAGLEHQDSGHIHVDGKRVDDLRPRERDVAMVFQSYALYPHLSAFDNIAAPLRMRRLSALQRFPLLGRFGPERRRLEAVFADEIGAVAEMLHLQTLLARKPGQLSGGQRQRVALARAIVRHPAVFLMDEPLSNLDAKLRDSTRTEIAALHRRLGATFIYVTHDQAEAMTMSDRIAVMMDGQILQVGTPAEIYNDPRDLRVASFIGSPQINLVDREIAGRLVTIGFRPHAAVLQGKADGKTISGSVTHIENLGSDLFVHLRQDQAVPDARVLVVRLDAAMPGPVLGARVHVKPQHVLCFDRVSGQRITSPAGGWDL